MSHPRPDLAIQFAHAQTRNAGEQIVDAIGMVGDSENSLDQRGDFPWLPVAETTSVRLRAEAQQSNQLGLLIGTQLGGSARNGAKVEPGVTVVAVGPQPPPDAARVPADSLGRLGGGVALEDQVYGPPAPVFEGLGVAVWSHAPTILPKPDPRNVPQAPVWMP